jgi:hypothetical protein
MNKLNEFVIKNNTLCNVNIYIRYILFYFSTEYTHSLYYISSNYILTITYSSLDYLIDYRLNLCFDKIFNNYI